MQGPSALWLLRACACRFPTILGPAVLLLGPLYLPPPSCLPLRPSTFEHNHNHNHTHNRNHDYDSDDSDDDDDAHSRMNRWTRQPEPEWQALLWGVAMGEIETTRQVLGMCVQACVTSPAAHAPKGITRT